MINLFLKIFIKNYEDVENVKVREAYGNLAGIVGIATNLILSIIKVFAGILSGSLAIIADGINNLSDMGASIITVAGFRLSNLPEDKEHPYGHARIEYLTGVIISIIVLAIGISLGKTSIEKIIYPGDLTFSKIAIGILLFSIILKIWQSYFYFTLGGKISSATLKAAGTDSRNDVISTVIVLISIMIYKLYHYNVDGYLSLLVAIFIIYSGISLIKETASPLIGEAAEEELVSDIVDTIKSKEGVLGVHDFIFHSYGKGREFGSIHVEVDAKEDILKSHELVDNIEKEIKKKFGINFVTHMDPVDRHNPHINNVREDLETYVSRIDGLSNIHDLRSVLGEERINIIFEVIISDECRRKEFEITDDLNEIVKNIDSRYNVIITFEKGYSSV